MNQGAKRLAEFLANHETISAAELARRCEISPAQLCHLVKARRVPTLEQAIALNRFARVPYDAWLQPAESAR